jgi:small subunit ribosomal protein S9
MADDDDDDDTPDTPEEETLAEHAVPTEEASEIAGSAEDAPLEALQEASSSSSGEHAQTEPAGADAPFDPIAGNAVPSEEAAEIAAVAEDAPLEAAQEAQELAEAQDLAETFEEAVAEEIAEKIVEEVVAEAIEAEAEEELVEAAQEAVVEELVAEVAEEAIEAELEAEEEAEEETAPREKPAVPGAHLEVDIVPEGVDPLGRDTDPADPYASVAEAYATDAEAPEGEGESSEEEEILAEPIASAAIDLASGARYRATGKRKTAIARVTLRPGTGTYLVNGRVLEEHFPRVTLQRNIRQPLETVGYQERMDVVARLHGGGISAQAGALRHGVSRALLEADPNLRGELKRRGFLTRDSRAKERKKAGLKKARKRPQFSKR